MGTLANAGIMALLSMFVSLAPMIMGIGYAIWPSESRLALPKTDFQALPGTCCSSRDGRAESLVP